MTNSVLFNLTPFFIILYAICGRLLLLQYIKSETRKQKLIFGINIWILFTIGNITFVDWFAKTFTTNSLQSSDLSLVSVSILIWDITWLFIFILYSFLKGKRTLSQKQKSILQDL